MIVRTVNEYDGEGFRELFSFPYKKTAETFELSDYFKGEFFKTKKVVYVPAP